MVTLYLTERCNSRCVTCDYWRDGRADLDLPAVVRLIPDLERLGTEVALISGGEPLLNPQWADIAGLLERHGLKVWLLTSGLALAKHAQRASALFRLITVSLDGADRETYAAIRGVDAFRVVCRGIRAAAGTGVPVTVRVTLQRTNFRQLIALVDLARELGAAQISFLAVDIVNAHAFGRRPADGPRWQPALDPALHPEDLPELERILASLERERAEAFESGFIAESPQKLGRILQYFRAVCGLGSYPPVHCNAPEFSAVIDARRRIHPCFFIPGPADAVVGDNLDGVLKQGSMVALRDSIRRAERIECSRCVCSMWREPHGRGAGDFFPLARQG